MNATKLSGRSPRFLRPPDPSLRELAEEYWLRFVRSFTYNTPFQKGKYRLSISAQSLCRKFPKRVVTPTRDGRTLEVNFSPFDWDTIFFFGEYERSLSRFVSSMVKPGDLCFDVGANLGWYTTLLSRLVGRGGSVHAFEPVPPTFAELRTNTSRLDDPSNVRLNMLAVGDRSGRVTIGFDEAGSTGIASIATTGGDVTSFECEMVSVSEYISKHLGAQEVTFVKVDIEGSEMMMFHGAERLFQQERMPILLVEMAADWGALCGYAPNDLLDFISQRGDYRFFAFEVGSERVREFERFAPGEIGANVLCVPRSGYEDRLEELGGMIA